MDKRHPKLRSVSKSLPPFPLNVFPTDFPYSIGKELIYLLATKGEPDLEGKEWEKIFAHCIGAQWKPSNVGLDDVIMGNTAWGAKTVKSTHPGEQDKVRLISGRNSPLYSFDRTIDANDNPEKLGGDVLNIWNERVSKVYEKFQNLRTVVLVKSNDLTKVSVFEFDTIRYDYELFSWKWNKQKNLEGFDKSTNEHRFTWQPHGSQFTIVESVPAHRLIIAIRKPAQIDKMKTLAALNFDSSWITVIQK